MSSKSRASDFSYSSISSITQSTDPQLIWMSSLLSTPSSRLNTIVSSSSLFTFRFPNLFKFAVENQMMLASFSHNSAQPAVGRYANTAPLSPEEHTFRNDAKMTPISGLYRALSCDSNSNGFQTTPVNGLLSSTPLAMEHLQVAHQAQLEPFKRPDDINASSAGVDLKKRNPFYDQAAYTK